MSTKYGALITEITYDYKNNSRGYPFDSTEKRTTNLREFKNEEELKSWIASRSSMTNVRIIQFTDVEVVKEIKVRIK